MQHRALRAGVVCYGALVGAPLPALLVGVTPAAFLTGGLVGALAGLLVTDRYDFETAVLSMQAVIPAIFVPLVWIVLGVRAGLPVRIPSYWLAGTFALIVWLAVLVGGTVVRQRRRLERLTEHATFEARPPEYNRRQLKIAGVGFFAAVVLLVVGFATLGSTDTDMTTLLPILVPLWIPLLAADQSREVSVTDEGVVVQQSLHEWETIEGYELDEDTLTITRGQWYHDDQRFDRDDIDDVDAVTSALDRHLTDQSVRG